MAEMKSAVELALEKLGKLQTDTTPEPLTEEQKQRMSELRTQYDAKIAEKEIMMQSDIRKLMQRHPPQEAAAAARGLQEQYQDAKKALQRELDEKISAIRAG